MPDLFDTADPAPTVIMTRACRCGSRRFRVLPPVGPHAAGLRCANCEFHGGWLSKEEYGAIQRGEAKRYDPRTRSWL